jgi:hypothetical protein
MKEIWHEFVDYMKSGAFPSDKVQPYHPLIKEPLLRILDRLRNQAKWEEWLSPDEVYQIDNQVHFLLPLTFGDQQDTYCFSFVIEEKQWYFQHIESITIRLDQITSLPTSIFPDIPESQKAWIREELHVSEQIRLFKQIVDEKGKLLAYEWFKDGAGYVMAAKTWVPFTRIERAFILYLCWEQANIRGNDVVLQKLDDREAIVQINPIYFRLYQQTVHIRQLIHWEDYRQLFEIIWQDRAKQSSWELEIGYEGDTCILHFTR